MQTKDSIREFCKTKGVVSKTNEETDTRLINSMSKMSLDSIRQNFHDLSESAINEQINVELYASYMYLSLAYNFDRTDVALNGFYKFFQEQSLEERGHAELLMKYMNQRGGSIVLKDIKAPLKYDFKTGLEAMKAALQLEKDVNQNLLRLHVIASEQNDPHLTNFVEEHFLNEQVESIKQIAGYITNLEKVDDEYQFDRLTLQK